LNKDISRQQLAEAQKIAGKLIAHAAAQNQISINARSE